MERTEVFFGQPLPPLPTAIDQRLHVKQPVRRSP
jgi:hypothetical protein